MFRLRFKLSSFLVAMALGAVFLGIAGRMIRGELCTEGSWAKGRPYITYGRGPGNAVTIPCENSVASEVTDRFDREKWNEAAVEIHQQLAPGTDYFTDGIVSALMTSDDIAAVRFDFVPWGRRRLDLSSRRFVFDTQDPVATARNRTISKAYFDAALQQLRSAQNTVRLAMESD